MTAWQITREPGRVVLAGELRLAHGAAIWSALQASITGDDPALDLDVSRAQAIDGAIMALVVAARASIVARGGRSEIVCATAPIGALAHLYGGDELVAPERPRAPVAGFVTRVGDAAAGVGERARLATEFAGELAASAADVLRRPASAGARGFGVLLERAAADGIPIVLVLNFLVGFVMAYQSTRQLRSYGANLYVADIVGIAMTRELAPLITAIIIAGRSGAAYAAELGTMRVTEEIDALRTMGFRPMPYLVLPRVAALAIASPMLALLGDVAGTAGGLAVGVSSLGVSPHAYVIELQRMVVPSDVWSGLIKSCAFGIAIACIGCQQGLATRGAASGVGRGTTATIVYCLFTLVVIDTVCTVIFRGFNV